MATILPQINDEMIETSNDEELENRLAEKEQFAKDHEKYDFNCFRRTKFISRR